MTAAPSERTRVKRGAKRADYDFETVVAIVDAQPLCHVGVVHDGRPVVTPTICWREGDRVYWHGSSASRMIRAAAGAEVSLTVSLMDGWVMARSAFHHSANYRSAMVFGKAEQVADAAKAKHLERMIETFFPGRWATLRPMLDKELKATTVLSLSLHEASAKIRAGGPVDDEEDYTLPIWAGVLPTFEAYGTPEPDPRNLDGVELPADVKAFLARRA